MAEISKADVRSALSHQRQLERSAARAEQRKRENTQKSRQRKAEAKQRSAFRQQEQAAKVAANAQIIAQRQAAKDAAGQTKRGRYASSDSRRDAILSGAGRAAPSVFNAATLSSGSNLFLVAVMMIIMLALFYQVVTRAEAFSGFANSAGDFLHKLSSTTPLFQTVQKS